MWRFLEIGTSGEPYPEEIHSLRRRRPRRNGRQFRTARPGKSGVYVIRDRQTKQILYVGESHSGCLYETLVRHFAANNDRNGSHGRAHAWHVCYNRADVEVAVKVVRKGRAVALQDRWIVRFMPRDNRNIPAPAPF